MFDQYPPHPASRSRRLAAEAGALIVFLVLAVLTALFAMTTPEPTPQIHGSADFTQVVTVFERTSASASVHYPWDR